MRISATGRSRIAAIRSVAPEATRPPKSPGCSGVGRHDLVAGPDAEAAQDDVAPLRRRARERDLLGLRSRPRELAAQALALLQHLLEVGPARPPLLQLPALDRLHRLHGRARERAERAGVQVGVPLEHRQARRTATRSMRSPPRPGRGRRARRRRTRRRSSARPRARARARPRGRGSGRSRRSAPRSPAPDDGGR